MDSKWCRSCTKRLPSVSFWTCSRWISYQFSPDMDIYIIDHDPAVFAGVQDAAGQLHLWYGCWELSKWMWRRCHNGVITLTSHLNLPLTGNVLLFRFWCHDFHTEVAHALRGKQGNWIHRNTGLASSRHREFTLRTLCTWYWETASCIFKTRPAWPQLIKLG